MAVETGCCPRPAIGDDGSENLWAVERQTDLAPNVGADVGRSSSTAPRSATSAPARARS